MSEVTPIDSSKVEVTITEIDKTDRRLDITVPAELVALFIENLKISKAEIDARQLHSLMVEFCKREAMARLGGLPFFGPAPLPSEKKPVLEVDAPFSMSFMCDVVPKIEWPDFSTLSIVRPVREITEELIEAELKNQCMDAGKRSVHDGVLEVFDEVEGSFRLSSREEGKELLTIDTVTIRLFPAGTPVGIHGLTFSGVSEALLGKSVGDTVTQEIVVPRGFAEASMQGTLATMEIVLRQTWRISPATVEEVLAVYGTPNEVILRQQIRFSLQERVESDQLGAMTMQILDALYATLDVPIPNRVLELESNKAIGAYKKRIEASGRSPEEAESIASENEELLRLAVKRQLATLVLVRCLATELQQSVSEQEVTDRISSIAATQGRRPEDVRREVVENGQVGVIRDELLGRKVVLKLLDKVTITDMDATEWNTIGAKANNSDG